jgi:hypothetical protein
MLLTRRSRSSAKAKVHPKPRAKASAGDAFDEAQPIFGESQSTPHAEGKSKRRRCF